MRIYIPTLGRCNNQRTWQALPKKLQDITTLVAPYEEKNRYTGYPNVLITSPTIKGIGPTRQFIIEHHAAHNEDGRLLMLDDDLSFAKRREDEPDKFVDAEPADIVDAVRAVDKALKRHAHVGILSREGGNRFTHGDVENVRLLRALGYDAHVLLKHGVKFNRIIVMEDFDVALQLLRLGYPSLAITKWVQDQTGGSNAPGGCSTYRTMEKQMEGAIGLHRLHPDFVRLVEKTTKTAWGGQTRTDVVVSWKKAYNANR